MKSFFYHIRSLFAKVTTPSLIGRAGGESIVLLALTLSACNSWLDVQPRSQVEDTELFETESGYKEALAGV